MKYSLVLTLFGLSLAPVICVAQIAIELVEVEGEPVVVAPTPVAAGEPILGVAVDEEGEADVAAEEVAAEVEVVADDIVVDGEAIAVVADDDEAVKEEGILEQAVGGFFDMIGNGFGGGRQPKPNKKLYAKDVDKIESLEELEKLRKELGKDPNLRGMMPQYKGMFKSQCDAELRLVHLICDLTRSEFTAIEKDARLASMRGLVQICQQQGQMMNGGGVVMAAWGGAPKTSRRLSPNERMDKSLSEAVDRELDDARANKYKKEVLARREFKKTAIVEVLTAGFDTLLILTPEQRADVQEVLRGKWKPEWENSSQYLMNNGIRYVPGIPKSEIRKLLTDEQGEVFKSIRWQPQNGVQYFNGFDMFGFNQNQNIKLELELAFADETKDQAGGEEE